jgi:hypothetical protein
LVGKGSVLKGAVVDRRPEKPDQFHCAFGGPSL